MELIMTEKLSGVNLTRLPLGSAFIRLSGASGSPSRAKPALVPAAAQSCTTAGPSLTSAPCEAKKRPSSDSDSVWSTTLSSVAGNSQRRGGVVSESTESGDSVHVKLAFYRR